MFPSFSQYLQILKQIIVKNYDVKNKLCKIFSETDITMDMSNMGLVSSPQGDIVDVIAPRKIGDAKLAAIAEAKGTESETAWSKLLGELITLMGGTEMPSTGYLQMMMVIPSTGSGSFDLDLLR